jgi:hypothetical protein
MPRVSRDQQYQTQPIDLTVQDTHQTVDYGYQLMDDGRRMMVDAGMMVGI